MISEFLVLVFKVFAIEVFAIEVFAIEVFAIEVFAIEVFAIEVFAIEVSIGPKTKNDPVNSLSIKKNKDQHFFVFESELVLFNCCCCRSSHVWRLRVGPLDFQPGSATV